jgi:23S rRNA pseudouridine955/2504/2580 synthase
VIYRDDHVIALNKPPDCLFKAGSKQSRHVDGLPECAALGMRKSPVWFIG